MSRPAFTLAVTALAIGCTTETVIETRVEQGTAVDHGKALFSDPSASSSTLNEFSCATCHVAEGAPDRILSGAKLAGAPGRPLFWGGQENDLLRSINHCRYYFMLAQQPWTAEDEEAKAMWAYLTSLPPEEPAPVPFTVVLAAKDVPAGNAAKGAAVYSAACATCHGAAHTGFARLTPAAPILPEDADAEHTEYTADERRLIYVEKVRHGGFLQYGGVMPPFSREALSDEQMADLLAHLGQY
jgi:thiosulfate dehydrogenase